MKTLDEIRNTYETIGEHMIGGRNKVVGNERITILNNLVEILNSGMVKRNHYKPLEAAVHQTNAYQSMSPSLKKIYNRYTQLLNL